MAKYINTYLINWKSWFYDAIHYLAYLNCVYNQIQPLSGLPHNMICTVGCTHGYSHSIPLGC